MKVKGAMGNELDFVKLGKFFLNMLSPPKIPDPETTGIMEKIGLSMFKCCAAIDFPLTLGEVKLTIQLKMKIAEVEIKTTPIIFTLFDGWKWCFRFAAININICENSDEMCGYGESVTKKLIDSKTGEEEEVALDPTNCKTESAPNIFNMD
jgi:hypothetical protein